MEDELVGWWSSYPILYNQRGLNILYRISWACIGFVKTLFQVKGLSPACAHLLSQGILVLLKLHPDRMMLDTVCQLQVLIECYWNVALYVSIHSINSWVKISPSRDRDTAFKYRKGGTNNLG